jgi:hypothetical protein
VEMRGWTGVWACACTCACANAHTPTHGCSHAYMSAKRMHARPHKSTLILPVVVVSVHRIHGRAFSLALCRFLVLFPACRLCRLVRSPTAVDTRRHTTLTPCSGAACARAMHGTHTRDARMQTDTHTHAHTHNCTHAQPHTHTQQRAGIPYFFCVRARHVRLRASMACAHWHLPGLIMGPDLTARRAASGTSSSSLSCIAPPPHACTQMPCHARRSSDRAAQSRGRREQAPWPGHHPRKKRRGALQYMHTRLTAQHALADTCTHPQSLPSLSTTRP